MHELSIATSLVRLAGEAVADSDQPTAQIEAVRVRIGDLSGVVIEALEFAWDVAREDTACADARLEMERVPGRIRCTPCQAERTLVAGEGFRCPTCGTPSAEVIGGRDLDLVSLELIPDSTPTPDPIGSASREPAHAATHS